MRLLPLAGVLLLAVGCGGGSTTTPTAPSVPAVTKVTLSGTVTATNGGYTLGGVAIDVGGQHVLTDSSGGYRVSLPLGRYTLMISGTGLLPHTQTVSVASDASLLLDVIQQGGGFDLGFYRQLVRDGLEEPNGLERLQRWTVNPTFTIETTDNTGAPVDPVRSYLNLNVPAVFQRTKHGHYKLKKS